MKKTTVLVGVGMVLSVLGFFLRKYQISVVKNPETLLFTPMAQESLLLLGLLVLGHLVLGVLVMEGARLVPRYEYAVYTPHGAFFGGTILSGFLLIMAFFIGLMDVKNGYDVFMATNTSGESYPFPLLKLAELSLVVVTGPVIWYLGKNAYEGRVLTERWLLTLPAFAALLHVYSKLKDLAITPDMQEKLYPSLGLLVLAHGIFALASTGIKTPCPRKVVFFAWSAQIFFCVNIHTIPSLYDGMVSFGLHLYLIVLGYGVMANSFCSQREYTTPPLE